MYMVISMPKRRSTARGVSHFMMPPSVQAIFSTRSHAPEAVRLRQRHHHEIDLMIFMSRQFAQSRTAARVRC
jgi:hypothetical protein